MMPPDYVRVEIFRAAPEVARAHMRDAVAAEREACAKLIEQMAADSPGGTGPGWRILMDTASLAKAIRARK